jgi:hypothetical protein
LTTLRIAKATFLHMSEILRWCLNLVRGGYSGGFPKGQRIDQVQLEKLKSLEIELHPYFDPWTTFILPAVDSLTLLDGREYCRYDLEVPFIPFQCQL